MRFWASCFTFRSLFPLLETRQNNPQQNVMRSKGIRKYSIRCSGGLRGVCIWEAAVVSGNEHCTWSLETWGGIFTSVAYALCNPWVSSIQKEVRVITTKVIALWGCFEDNMKLWISKAFTYWKRCANVWYSVVFRQEWWRSHTHRCPAVPS